MELSDTQGFGRQVDAQHFSTLTCGSISQYSTATTNVYQALVRQGHKTLDPPQTQGIDLMERLELTLQIPPTMGELGEFSQFGRVGVDSGCHGVIM
jgi:hypothetical protein